MSSTSPAAAATPTSATGSSATSAPVELVVTADDFGLSPAVNLGVVAAHVNGIVTATSLMVRRDAAADAAALARELPDLAVGLHLELASYDVVGGEWVATEQRCDLADPEAIAAELADQLERFVELVGAAPTHLDSHHHLHLDEPVASVVAEHAARVGLAVRGRGRRRYVGDFYGQYGTGIAHHEAISPAALATLVGSLGPGPHELACHPAVGTDPAHGVYDAERVLELEALCHPEVRAAAARHASTPSPVL